MDGSEWHGWQLRKKEADIHNAFDARDIFSVVKETQGAVLILGGLKSSSIAPLQERLAQRYIVVQLPNPAESTEIYDAICRALSRHRDGDPHVPTRLAVALMLVRKLKRGNYWGGDAKAKAYLSVDELAKGRGVDEHYRSDATEVANVMQQKGLFKRKTGDGHAKYALNSSRSTELHEFLRSWKVEDKGLQKYLYGGEPSVSARELERMLADSIDDEAPKVPMDELSDIIPEGWSASAACYPCEDYRDLPTVIVALRSIEPPRRKGMNAPHFDVPRLRRLAQGLVAGHRIPPIEVTPKSSVGAYPYRVRNGFHRYHLCIELGFTKIPVVEIEPLDE
jgi:hypothetical protein